MFFTVIRKLNPAVTTFNASAINVSGEENTGRLGGIGTFITAGTWSVDSDGGMGCIEKGDGICVEGGSYSWNLPLKLIYCPSCLILCLVFLRNLKWDFLANNQHVFGSNMVFGLFCNRVFFVVPKFVLAFKWWGNVMSLPVIHLCLELSYG